MQVPISHSCAVREPSYSHMFNLTQLHNDREDNVIKADNRTFYFNLLPVHRRVGSSTFNIFLRILMTIILDIILLRFVSLSWKPLKTIFFLYFFFIILCFILTPNHTIASFLKIVTLSNTVKTLKTFWKYFYLPFCLVAKPTYTFLENLFVLNIKCKSKAKGLLFILEVIVSLGRIYHSFFLASSLYLYTSFFCINFSLIC